MRSASRAVKQPFFFLQKPFQNKAFNLFFTQSEVQRQESKRWSPYNFHYRKCTLVQALMLCTGRTAHRGSRGIALLFHDHGTRRGWGVSVKPRPLFTPGERPGTHCTRGWVGPRAGPDSCGKCRPTGIRSQERPARSQSLYRLSYPAHFIIEAQHQCSWTFSSSECNMCGRTSFPVSHKYIAT